jgi:hypothetical protein
MMKVAFCTEWNVRFGGGKRTFAVRSADSATATSETHRINDIGPVPEGARLATVGACGEGFESEYEVAEFTYQLLPQKEIHWGWWFPIYRVTLSKVWKGGDTIWPGLIRVLPGGLMELRCVSPRGMFEWVAIPGCMTRRPAGKIYERWSIVVGGVDDDDQMPRTMVRYDGQHFEHWPENS